MKTPPIPSDLQTALQVDWHRPPASLRRQARRLPLDAALAPPSLRSARRRMTPGDIRSLAVAREKPRVENHSFDEAEVTLRCGFEGREGLLRIDGRIWLEEDSARESGSKSEIEVALVQDDHVLAGETVADGGVFTIVEALRGQWVLEFHLPGRGCLVIEGENS